jgi:hypothetical protein
VPTAYKVTKWKALIDASLSTDNPDLVSPMCVTPLAALQPALLHPCAAAPHRTSLTEISQQSVSDLLLES